MSQSSWRKLHDLKPAASDYRVLEHMRGDLVWLSIHRVSYDDDGEPIRFDEEAAHVGGMSGDALVVLLDQIAQALTKPSLLASEFKAQALPGLGMELRQ